MTPELSPCSYVTRLLKKAPLHSQICVLEASHYVQLQPISVNPYETQILGFRPVLGSCIALCAPPVLLKWHKELS